MPLDKETLATIKKKHKAWKKYINSKESEAYRDYCKARNQVKKTNQIDKKKFRKICGKRLKIEPPKILEICEQ